LHTSTCNKPGETKPPLGDHPSVYLATQSSYGETIDARHLSYLNVR